MKRTLSYIYQVSTVFFLVHFLNTCTVRTSLIRTLWDVISLVLITEVSSIQRSLNTLQYHTGTQKGVLIIEVSTFQRFVIERSHCIYIDMYVHVYVHDLGTRTYVPMSGV